MRLIGPFGSPYTRRVAITLKFYGLEYEHTKIVPFGDGKAKLRRVNPLARIPVLELDDGACIVESGTILDYLDTLVDAESSLTPRTGPARRQVLNYVSVASGATDKLVSVLYEFHFRPRDMVYRPWIEMCERQVIDGFKWLDDHLEQDWFVGDSMTQADLSIAVFWQFGCEKRRKFFARMGCERLQALSERLDQTRPFAETLPEGGLPTGIAPG